MAKDVAEARGWLEGYLTNPSRIRDRLGVVLDSAEDGGDVGGGLSEGVDLATELGHPNIVAIFEVGLAKFVLSRVFGLAKFVAVFG